MGLFQSIRNEIKEETRENRKIIFLNIISLMMVFLACLGIFVTLFIDDVTYFIIDVCFLFISTIFALVMMIIHEIKVN